ncbi:MAG TPA: cytochrome P450, partial [Herpetosiphonaceae bacterium]|nr:cytochrome P450 [Herpetosiphonaceae bacterium]
MFLLGNLPEMKPDGQLAMLVRAWRQYGDLVRFRMGPKSLYLVAHTEDVRHILVDNRANYCKGFGHEKLKALVGMGLLTSEGELWQHQRRL